MMIEPSDGYRPFPVFIDWQATPGPVWDEYVQSLDSARKAAHPDTVRGAIDIALRSAAFQTGAIEGLYAANREVTHLVALQGALWEASVERIGPDVRGHFEAQLAALELVLDAAKEKQPITQAWLRELQAQVCAAQKTYKAQTAIGWQEQLLEHGQYKQRDNSVILADGSKHWYAPVGDVKPEMERLIDQLLTSHFVDAHPVLQSSYAHYALTAVHPFQDGNGRTARALASVYLYRAAGVPLVVFSDQQLRYWDALIKADNGQPQAFAAFIEARALDTMAMIADLLRQSKAPLGNEAARLRTLLISHGGLSHAEVQTAGHRLTQALQQAIQTQLDEIGLLPDVRRWIEPKQGRLQCDFGRPYHCLNNGGAFKFGFRIDRPIELQTEMTPFIGLAEDTRNPFTFIVIDANRPAGDPLRLRVDDLHPGITEAAQKLIDGWADKALRPVLAELASAMSAGLKREGF
jgi:Fic family protein